ncbi:methyltransferase family protein [Dokdonella sp.]|uniref:methyltransferase family protein n=1 Tax=Dokdonella sp. TaxID=2291710 RepID=UPI003AF5B0C3
MMQRLELRLPPVLIVLAAALAMWLAAHWLPALAVPALPAWAALIPVIGGLGCMLAGIAAFRRARTTANPMTPGAASVLVTGGIYRVTRNPMYLGLALGLTGWALYLGNLGALMLVPGFVFFLTRFQILPEERALQARFGATYASYRRRVRRWI